MRTKLYSMWIKFCKAPEKWRAMANNVWVDRKTGFTYSPYDVAIGKAKNVVHEGVICFNYKHNGIRVQDKSSEYHAWNAFMTAKESSDDIVEFIMKNFTSFKRYLPATCIFLDLHKLKSRDMLKQCSKSFMEEFKQALMLDINGRKCGK